MGKEINTKIEEIRDKMAEEIEAATKKTRKKTDPPFDKYSLNIKIPDEFLIKILFEKLKLNAFKNRGYIIEGFPKTYDMCTPIFLINKEGKEIRNPETFPNYFFLIKQGILYYKIR